MSAAHASPESFEQQAVQQRERLHRTAMELVSKVDDARQRLTVSYHVRHHFLTAAVVASAVSLACGYVLGVMLADRP